MPSIALFIKQLLSEDKYSSDFSDRISERINELNAAQLQGIYNHLVATAKTAKSETWSWANRDLVSKIEGVLKERVAEAEKIEKILEENRLKAVQKHRKLKEAKTEQKRVMRMIAENARKTAEAAVREEEQRRVAEEKGETMAKVFKAEERRDEWWKRTAVFFVIGVVVVCATIKDIIILFPCLFVVFLITGILVYRAQQFTVIVPRTVDEGELEMEIERRGEVLQKKAISVLREKERKFQEQQARDEEERKARKALKKQQAKFEAQLMIARRQQQLAQATEILTRRTTTAGTDNSSRYAPGSARSQFDGSQFGNTSDNGNTSVRDKGGFFAQNPSMSSLASHGDYQAVHLPTIVDLEGVESTDTAAGEMLGIEIRSASFPEDPHTDDYSSHDERSEHKDGDYHSEHSGRGESHDDDGLVCDLDSSEDEALRRMEQGSSRSRHARSGPMRDYTPSDTASDIVLDTTDAAADAKESLPGDDPAEQVTQAAQMLLELTQHNEEALSRRNSSTTTAVAAGGGSSKAQMSTTGTSSKSQCPLPVPVLSAEVAEPKAVEMALEDMEEGYARPSS